jgi:hypothetical protein
VSNQVVTEQDVTPAQTVHRETVVSSPNQVVSDPEPAYVQRRSDPMLNSMAASGMIQTVIWSIVVIALLVVGILVLLHYGII